MARSTEEDAQALLRSLRSDYAATPKNLKTIDLYGAFVVYTALFQIHGFLPYYAMKSMSGLEKIYRWP